MECKTLHLELFDDLMNRITQTDAWHKEQLENPEIQAAEQQLTARLNEIRDKITAAEYNQVVESITSQVLSFETAAILYGMRLAAAIRDVSMRPSDLSQATLDRIQRLNPTL